MTIDEITVAVAVRMGVPPTDYMREIIVSTLHVVNAEAGGLVANVVME